MDPSFDIFVIYGDGDTGAARELAKYLAPRRVFVRADSMLPGDEIDTLDALQRSRLSVVLLSSHAEFDSWRRNEIVVAVERSKNEQSHRAIPLFLGGKPADLAKTPFGLGVKVGIDARAVGGIRGVAAELIKLIDEPSAQTKLVDNPFRVLSAFSSEDAKLFFGRELITRDLVSCLEDHRFCVLHGSSGTGKSSLLHAGVKPRVEGSFAWVEAVPGNDLAAAIDRAACEELRRRSIDPAGAATGDHLLQLSSACRKPVLLVIDQLEELFQKRNEPQIKRAAREVATIFSACFSAGANRGSVHILLSVRGDYFGHLCYLRDEGLKVFDQSVLLHPFDRTAAQLAIEEPLSLAGHSIDRDLLRRLLDDLAHKNREVRPVELEIVCHELFQAARARSTRRLSAGLYQSLGGAGNVLGVYLRQALELIDEPRRPLAQRALRAMVGIGGIRADSLGAEAIAKISAVGQADVQSVLDHLVSVRLVEASADRAEYRLAHDVVASEVYVKLGEEEKRELILRERLRLRALEWVARGRSLAAAKSVTPADRADLTAAAANLRGIDPEQDEFLATLEKLASRARIQKIGFMVTCAVLATAGATGLWLANEQFDAARSERAELQAERWLSRDPGRALGWLREAIRLRDAVTPRDYVMAQEALNGGIGSLLGHADMTSQPQFTPVGDATCTTCWPARKLLLVRALSSTGGFGYSFDGSVVPALGPPNLVYAIDGAVLVDRGRKIAGVKNKEALFVWGISTLDGARPMVPIRVSEHHPVNGQTLVSSLSGKYLAAIGNNEVFIWNSDDWRSKRLAINATRLVFSSVQDDLLNVHGEKIFEYRIISDSIEQIGELPDHATPEVRIVGSRLVTRSSDGRLVTNSGETWSTEAAYLGSTTGHWIAWSTFAGEIRARHIGGTAELVFRGNEGPPVWIGVTPGDDSIVAIDAGKRVTTWPIAGRVSESSTSAFPGTAERRGASVLCDGDHVVAVRGGVSETFPTHDLHCLFGGGVVMANDSRMISLPSGTVTDLYSEKMIAPKIVVSTGRRLFAAVVAENVRLVARAPNWSLEFCGGLALTHAPDLTVLADDGTFYHLVYGSNIVKGTCAPSGSRSQLLTVSVLPGQLRARSMAVSYDGNLLAIAGDHQVYLLWTDGSASVDFEVRDRVRNVAFTDEDRALAVLTERRTIFHALAPKKGLVEWLRLNATWEITRDGEERSKGVAHQIEKPPWNPNR